VGLIYDPPIDLPGSGHVPGQQRSITKHIDETRDTFGISRNPFQSLGRKADLILRTRY